jgi:hypothetical protein
MTNEVGNGVVAMVNCLIERLGALPVSMPARTSTTAALGEDSLTLARSVIKSAYCACMQLMV